MFNRAQALVVEAAILISRLSMYSREDILKFFRENERVVFKTGSLVERRAWKYLKRFLEEGERV